MARIVTAPLWSIVRSPSVEIGAPRLSNPAPALLKVVPAVTVPPRRTSATGAVVPRATAPVASTVDAKPTSRARWIVMSLATPSVVTAPSRVMLPVVGWPAAGIVSKVIGPPVVMN